MIALLLSPLGRCLGGAVAVAALAGALWLAGDHHGAARVQVQFDAYRTAEKIVRDAEVKRQKDQGSEAVAKLQADLDAAQSADADSDEAIRKLQAAVAAKPVIPGRGATADDVEALNR